MDVPDFSFGTDPTRVGMFLPVFDPTAFSADYLERVEAQLVGLQREHGINFGRHTPELLQLRLPEAVHARLVAAVDGLPVRTGQ